MDVHDQETPHAMSHETRIALLVPDTIISSGIETLLQKQLSGYEISAFDAFQHFLAQAINYDMLLIDVSEHSLAEVENVLNHLQACCPALRVLVISDRLNGAYIRRVIQLGARGFLHRGELSKTLLGNVTLATRDVVALSSEAARLLTENAPPEVSSLQDLKQTDMQVLHMMAQGAPIKQIAHTLDISERSIYRIRDKLRRLLGVTSSELIVSAAREQGLLQPGDDISRPLHPD